MSDDGTMKRLEELEIKFAFQTNVLEDLNTTVTKQWDEIDTLQKQLKYLKEQILNLKEQGPQTPDNMPPPHY